MYNSKHILFKNTLEKGPSKINLYSEYTVPTLFTYESKFNLNEGHSVVYQILHFCLRIFRAIITTCH